MRPLRELVVDVSVPSDATFADAARALAAAGAAAAAVLAGRRVVGLLTTDDVLRGLFPRYLDELEHTSFLARELVAARLATDEPLTRYMSKAVTVDADAASAHVAELFLHCPPGALVVVDDRKDYVGMLTETAFVAELVNAFGG